MKILDVRLSIDGLILPDDKNIDDVVKEIEDVIKSNYPIQVDLIMRSILSSFF